VTFGRGISPHSSSRPANPPLDPLHGPRDGPYVDEIALSPDGRTFVPYISFALKYDTRQPDHPTGAPFILQGEARQVLGSQEASFNA